MRFAEADMTELRGFSFRDHPYRAYVCPDDWHPSHWTFEDEKELRALWWNIKPGDIIADVGADFGSYTLTALACGAARAHVWSPPFKDPLTPVELHTLLRSAVANGWGQSVLPYEGGLWSCDGWLAAFDGPRMATLHKSREGALAATQDQGGHCATFPVMTLDSAMGAINRLDWLKIDTEGAELDILIGGEQVLRATQPKIILEHHYHLDDECEDKCTAFLEALGYRQTERRPHHTLAHSLYTWSARS